MSDRPWLPPNFEPLEMLADGTRLNRDTMGANDDGRETLISRIELARGRVDIGRGAIVEVGSWAGAHALKLAHLLKKPFRLYCIDTWAGTRKERADATTSIAGVLGPDFVYRTFKNNTRHVPEIVPMRMTSVMGADQLATNSLAVVFIDADHSYEAVKDDIAAWWPRVSPGGLLCGHDYHLFYGVKKAVDEWVAAVGLPLIVEGECWFVEKPK